MNIRALAFDAAKTAGTDVTRRPDIKNVFRIQEVTEAILKSSWGRAGDRLGEKRRTIQICWAISNYMGPKPAIWALATMPYPFPRIATQAPYVAWETRGRRYKRNGIATREARSPG